MGKSLQLVLSAALGLALAAGCAKKKTDDKKSVGDMAPMAMGSDNAMKGPSAPPVMGAKPKPVTLKKIELKKIDPKTLKGKLAAIYQATKGLSYLAGQWKSFHEAAIKRHGKPTATIQMYGKPAYFWAAREGAVCVQFGYPQPDNLKAKLWTTWQPSVVTQPPKGLPFPQDMTAARDWKECVAYSEGRNPRKK